jgi:uncharacterized membrane protein
MKIGTFVIKIWRWLSIILVVGALTWTYSLFPDMVAVDFSESGLAEKYVSKEHIFYLIMALFLVNNVVISRLSRQVSNIHTDHLPILKKKAWAGHREALNEQLVNWIYCLVASINTIIGFSLFALATINSSNYKMDVFDFSWIFYAGTALMLLVFLLPLRLLWTPAPNEEL